MAVRGTKPKPVDQRRNRNPSSVDWTEVENVPYDGPSPDLPTERTIITRNGPQTVDFQEMTHDWYERIRRMPHCILWTETDWLFAISTAYVADNAFSGVASAATELRNREKTMGTTFESLRDLRIRYVDPQPSSTEIQSAEVTQIDRYRDL